MEPLQKITLEKGLVYKPSRLATVTLLENKRISDPESPDDVRHLLLDMANIGMKYYEGQSIGILTPGEQDNGRAHKIRLYSVTSSRDGEDGKGQILALCVKREKPSAGNDYFGLCSNYLGDLKKGAKINITGPVGRTFLLPQDKSTDIIMFATGTGIAPYRGFAQYAQKIGGWQGKFILFMGCKSQKEALYLNQQNSDLKNFTFLEYHLALSRVEKTPDGSKMYVQYRLTEQLNKIWDILIKNNFSLYICGLKGIEEGIESIFAKKAEKENKNWSEIKAVMRKTGRLNLEVY